jgi:predicted MPP superfamily phosphohydrolase
MSQPEAAAPSTRRISRRAFLGLSLAASSALAVYAVGVEPSRLVVRRDTIAIPGLPRALDGLRIGQLSDPHRCPFVPRARVEHAVKMLAAEEPDLATLTGDFVSYWPDYAAEYAELLAPLQPPLGCFACLGNHDHYTDPDTVAAALREAGATVLRNQHHLIVVDSARLCIIGIDDIGASGISAHHAEPADDLPAALDGSPTSGVMRVLLAHNPDFVMGEAFEEETSQRPIQLVLSGHTHGGQVRLPLVGAPVVPSQYGQLFSGGLVQTAGTKVYVSRGAGSSWPLRFNCPPEINVLTLRTARVPA